MMQNVWQLTATTLFALCFLVFPKVVLADERVDFGYDRPPLGALPSGALHLRNSSNRTLFFFLSLENKEWKTYKLDAGRGALVRSSLAIVAIATSDESVVSIPSFLPETVDASMKIEEFDVVVLHEGSRAELCWSKNESAWVTQYGGSRRC